MSKLNKFENEYISLNKLIFFTVYYKNYKNYKNCPYTSKLCKLNKVLYNIVIALYIGRCKMI